MNSLRFSSRILSTSALTGLAIAHFLTPAAAQDAAGQQQDGATVLEDIIVNGGSGGVIQADGYVGKSSATGTKTDTPFIEVPQSISSVTEQQLKDRDPQSLLDTVAWSSGTLICSVLASR
ncbi:hypothetical protein [Rhizobium sp. T1470]|uniref:hypothetical protein n=1 Tax=unclassified Rhizobium TaxID=2613769 RepID=UPI0035D0A0B6